MWLRIFVVALAATAFTGLVGWQIAVEEPITATVVAHEKVWDFASPTADDLADEVNRR